MFSVRLHLAAFSSFHFIKFSLHSKCITLHISNPMLYSADLTNVCFLRYFKNSAI